MSEVVEEYTFYLIHPANTDKIQVYDETIRECYIGSTRKPDKRFIEHKSACINPESNNYNCKVYKHIRKTGGFDKWQISILETHTITKSEAHIHERWLIELYESALNTQIPSRTATEYDKAYHDSHKEQKAAYDKAYTEANREYVNAKNRVWHSANREEQNAKRRARRAAAKKAASI